MTRIEYLSHVYSVGDVMVDDVTGGESSMLRFYELQAMVSTGVPTKEVSTPVASPRPIPLRSVPRAAIPDGYMALCQSLDYAPTELLQVRFECLLLELNQPMFGFQAVMEYLKKQAPKDQRVIWKPLTVKDWAAAKVNLACEDNPYTLQNHYFTEGNVMLSKNPYQRLIPADVLDRVRRVRQDFLPEQAPFFVSDFEAIRPDPFMLTFFGNHVIVFDAWDEPGFGAGRNSC